MSPDVGVVVLTSSDKSFSGLAHALRDRGLAVEERPLIRFLPPADWGPVDAALANAKCYEAVAFTSPRAGRAVVERIRACEVSWPLSDGPVVWAVGRSTAKVLDNEFGTVRLPRPGAQTSGGSEALARAMLAEEITGPVLFPCGDKRRDELSSILRVAGVEVHEIVCYRTVLADETSARAAAASATLLVVASPSVVELLVRSHASPERPALVAVGPTTAAMARATGWPPAAMADEPTTEGLVAAITGLLARR